MEKVREVAVEARPPRQLSALLGDERAARFDALAVAAREGLAGRAVVNVNSTASGGGVAEMLRTLLAYARGVGIDTRWVVFEGNPAFFEVTKRIPQQPLTARRVTAVTSTAQHVGSMNRR